MPNSSTLYSLFSPKHNHFFLIIQLLFPKTRLFFSLKNATIFSPKYVFYTVVYRFSTYFPQKYTDFFPKICRFFPQNTIIFFLKIQPLKLTKAFCKNSGTFLVLFRICCLLQYNE